MNKKRFHFSSFFVIIGVVLVALVAGSTYTAYHRDLDLMQTKSASAFSADFNEISRQLIRFENELGTFADTRSDDARLKLMSRTQELHSQIGKLRTASNDFSTLPQTGDELMASLDQLVLNVDAILNSNTTAPLTTEIVQTEKMSADFETFVHTVSIDADAANIHIQESIQSSARNSILLSFLTVLLSVLGMAHFIRLNSQNEMMAAHNKILAERSEAGSQAKSRLLTMLSHEIRTPMNGVLGLVSLGLQQTLPDGQRKLMEQIRESALELITFLEDMLDFSNLDSPVNRHEHNLLFTSNVMVGLNDRLEASFARHGKALHFAPDHNLPSVVWGDSDRIQQSLFYLLSYISKNSFEEKVVVQSTIYKNHWLWRIDLSADSDANENWQINSLVGQSEGDTFIASDTIETAMARGLVESMNGKIRLVQGNVHKDKFRLLIYIPVQTISPKKPIQVSKYPFDTNWINEDAIMDSVPYNLLEEYQIGQADLVLCDPKSNSELRKLTDLRSAAPHAQIVSVGKTQFADLYDDVYLSKEIENVISKAAS